MKPTVSTIATTTTMISQTHQSMAIPSLAKVGFEPNPTGRESATAPSTAGRGTATHTQNLPLWKVLGRSSGAGKNSRVGEGRQRLSGLTLAGESVAGAAVILVEADPRWVLRNGASESNPTLFPVPDECPAHRPGHPSGPPPRAH